MAALRIVGWPVLFRGTIYAIDTPAMMIHCFVYPMALSCIGLFGVEMMQ